MNDVIFGDCLEVMRGMEPNSIDAIVTDPPYGLKFMGKAWDHGLPGEPFWAEAFAPVRGNVAPAPGFIPVRDLILPDNSQPGRTPVFFEGRLLAFERRVGVVFVTLAAPALPARPSIHRLFRRGDRRPTVGCESTPGSPGSTATFRWLGGVGRPGAGGRPHPLQRRFAQQVKPSGASALAVGGE